MGVGFYRRLISPQFLKGIPQKRYNDLEQPANIG
jgi:hypothetical protein